MLSPLSETDVSALADMCARAARLDEIVHTDDLTWPWQKLAPDLVCFEESPLWEHLCARLTEEDWGRVHQEMYRIYIALYTPTGV